MRKSSALVCIPLLGSILASCAAAPPPQRSEGSEDMSSTSGDTTVAATTDQNVASPASPSSDGTSTDSTTAGGEMPASTGEDTGQAAMTSDPAATDDAPAPMAGITCDAPVEDLISDFENGAAKTTEAGGRGGTSYFYYNDKTPGATLDPEKVPNTPLLADGEGVCGMTSFRFKATGFSEWGAGVGIDFLPKVDDKKVGFDASGYSGVAFYAKAHAPHQFFVNMQDMNTHEDGGQCVIGGTSDTKCDTFGGMITIGDQWELKTIMFADLQQRGFGKQEAAFDPSQAINFRLQAKGDFELWLDDIHFVR